MAQKHVGSVRFFVDIGAGDGISGSNTFYFAIRGASGVCFEPIKESYAKLRRLYWFNRKVICRNCGISDEAREAEIVDLQDCSYIPETEDQAHTRLLPLEQPARQIRQIRLLPFREAMRGITLPSVIDLLNIDVEGHELNVLRSIPFDRYTFRLIILETHLLNDTGELVWKHRDFDQMDELLADHGYRAICRTRANTFYSRDTDQSPPTDNPRQ